MEPRINLGRLLAAAGEPLAAAEHYVAALALDPGNLALLQEAVVHLTRYRQHDQALAALVAAEAHPGLTEQTRTFLDEAYARIYLARGEPERGESHLARALRARDDPGLTLLAAQYAAGRGDWRRVTDLLVGATAPPADNRTRRVLLARAHAELTDRSAGIADLQACLREDENWAEAHEALARLLGAEKAWHDALTQAARAVEIAPGTPAFYVTYIELLLAAGRCEEARSSAKDALQIFPYHAQVRALASQLQVSE